MDDQKQLQKRLLYAINEIGLKAKQISKITGIDESELSRFKTGKAMLCLPDVEKLNNYFDKFFMVEL